MVVMTDRNVTTSAPAAPATAPPDAAAVKRWRAAIFLAFLLGGVTLAAWGPRLPAVRTSLDIGTGGLGLLLAGVTIGSVVGLLLAAPLLARFGARTALPAAIVLIAASLALIGVGATVWHSIGVVAIAFVVIGLAIGALDVMINVEGSALEQRTGRSLMPLLHASWSGGAALGSGIGAVCAAVGVDAAWQFAGEAVLLVLAAVLIARWVPAGTRADEHGADAGAGQRFATWLRTWTDWRLLLIGLVMFGAELGEGSANNWLTLATRDGHGQAPGIAAAFFTVFALSEMTARIAGTPLVNRFGRITTVRATTALGIVGVALFIVAGTWWLALLGVVLWAVGVSMGFPLGMSAAAESGSNPAARVSVVAAIGYFANLAGPPAIGFLAQGTGLLGALWPLAILLLAALVASGSVRPKT